MVEDHCFVFPRTSGPRHLAGSGAWARWCTILQWKENDPFEDHGTRGSQPARPGTLSKKTTRTLPRWIATRARETCLLKCVLIGVIKHLDYLLPVSRPRRKLTKRSSLRCLEIFSRALR